jgi:hypothetical protein
VSSAVEDFRRAAQSYCALVEEADRPDAVTYELILERLSDLYAAALRLPRVEPETEHDPPDRPTDEDEAALIRLLSPLFEPRDVYWLVEPHEPTLEKKLEKNLLAGSLSEDLASVWRDVKRGLLAVDEDAPVDDVVFDWWFAFDSHWGRHAVDAMAALHKLRFA